MSLIYAKKMIKMNINANMFIIVVATLLLAAARGAGAETKLADFTTIANAKLDNQLPMETSGAAASVHRTLRPALSYPTLHADNVTLRQAPVSTGAEQEVISSAPVQSQFADVVSATLGRPLPLFASDYFAPRADQLEPVEKINVPGDFQLGPGDEVLIQAWGTIELDLHLTVDRQGCIHLPKVGELCVNGLTFSQLQPAVETTLKRAYKGFSLSVSLGQLRSIRVYVTGYAKSPGRYTVSSLTSLINAVLMSGGPASFGDPRRVELRRDGNQVAVFDLYDFLNGGALRTSIRLFPDDVIHIPVMRGQAAIAGHVPRPAIFHLGPSDTMADLIQLGGGLQPGTNAQRVVLERYDDAGQRVVSEQLLDESFLAQPVLPGDIVLIKPASPQFVNAVTLRGHVAQPLRHEWQPGMTVASLLPDTNALISPAYWEADLRATPLTLADQAPDRLDVAPTFRDINWDYAVIERISRTSAAVELLPFHLGQAMFDRDPKHNIELLPGDVIKVFARGDFATPIDSQRRFVRIEGEVARAGVYPVDVDTTVEDLIQIAGGTTRNAYLFGLKLTRETVREQQQLRKDDAIDRLDEDYQRHLINRSRNVLSGDLSLAIPPEADAIANLISRLRAAAPDGRIVMDLPVDIAAVDSLPGLTLRDKDRIYIPPRPDTVEVVGAVLQPGSTLHEPGMRVKDYLSRAGLIATADRSETYLVRPNGSFIRARNREVLVAGDTIVVPEKVDRVTAVRRLKDWTQVLYQFGLGAAGVKILTER